MNKINLIDMFVDNKPKVIGVVADVNQGKSNLIYYAIGEIIKSYQVKVYQYGLKVEIEGVESIGSIEQLETIENSIVFIDEFYTLFELENRKRIPLIEKTLRLINHKNNILVLCGLPSNFNKFVSGKLTYVVYKQCTITDFVNGSHVKSIALSYRGEEQGSSMLVIPKDRALVFDKNNIKYSMADSPYLEKYDTKKENAPILIPLVPANKVETPRGRGSSKG